MCDDGSVARQKKLHGPKCEIFKEMTIRKAITRLECPHKCYSMAALLAAAVDLPKLAFSWGKLVCEILCRALPTAIFRAFPRFLFDFAMFFFFVFFFCALFLHLFRATLWPEIITKLCKQGWPIVNNVKLPFIYNICRGNDGAKWKPKFAWALELALTAKANGNGEWQRQASNWHPHIYPNITQHILTSA